MTAASDAYATFLSKASELEALRKQGVQLVNEMFDLEKTILSAIPKFSSLNLGQGEVAQWAGRMMGLPHPPADFDLTAVAHKAYDRLF